VCCSVLQCVAVCCSVLQLEYGLEGSNVSSMFQEVCVLQCVAVCCSVLQCLAV